MSPEREPSAPDDSHIDPIDIFYIEIMRKEAKARRQFATELSEAIGSQVSFYGRPCSHVQVHPGPHGEQCETHIPFYSLMDTEREPVEYDDVKVVGVFDNGRHLGVARRDWKGHNYQLIPLDSITDFRLVESKASAI